MNAFHACHRFIRSGVGGIDLVDPTPEGEALYELILQAPRLHRLLQSLSAGDEPRWTIGPWGMLRSIKNDGRRTVPQIAHTLICQQIQKLVGDVEAEGLVRFDRTRITNDPASSRSDETGQPR